MVPKWTILSVLKCKIPKILGAAPRNPLGGEGGLQRPQTPQLLLHSFRECGSLRSYAQQTFRPTDKLPFSSLYAFQMESICRQKKLRLQAANIFVDHWVWMWSIDLGMHNTVFMVNPPFHQYFTCYWKGCYYEFLRMPNGYAQAPLLFTKLLKQPFGFLGNMVMLQLSI